MKQIALILLICVYSLPTFGIGVEQFYCCGKLKSTTITFVQPSKEKYDEGNATYGCCQTKYKTLKVKDSHVAADGIITPAKHFTPLHLYTPFFEVIPLANQPKSIVNTSHAPPPKTGIPIYILYCTYRI